jgi:hypothetical protein
MKTKCLLTTAALALTIGVSGVAAQNRYGANAQGDSAVQKKEPRKHERANRDIKPQETTGQASPGENRGSRKGEDEIQAVPSRSGQTSGEGNSENDNQGAANPRASEQDGRSGEIKRPGEANDKLGNKSTERSAQTPSGEKSREEAQSPRSTNDKTQSSGTAADERNDRSGQPPAASSSSGNARGEASGERTRDQAEAHGASGHARPAERLSAALKAPQKTRLTQAFEKVKVQPVTHVDFSVAVGTAVPRTIVLHPVPETIVDVIPEYRDYDFFVVRDEVVIVEPHTHRIVDVIERHGASRAEATTTKTRHKVKLSVKDRRYLIHHFSRKRTTVTTGAAPSETRIIVGDYAPRAAEIEAFPPEVYREVPAVRSYRYVHSGNDVYLVDPDSRRVIERIDEDDD